MKETVRLSFDQYLKLCARIEKIVSEIYAHWSQDPAHGEARELWFTMQAEEEDHFNQIEMLRRMIRKQEDPGTRTMSDEHVVKLVAYAEQCLKRIKASSLSTRKAILLAIQLEDLFQNFHVGQACDCKDAGIKAVFKDMARNDKQHAKRLKEAYKSLYSVDPPVRQVLVSGAAA